MTEFRIVQPTTDEELRSVHRFHAKNIGEFLFPRSLKELESIATDYALMAAFKGERLVGICYVTSDEKLDRWEFGGVIVDEATGLRGSGLASALGTVAIAHQFYLEATAPRDLIAHVHVANDLPRKLLERLGFNKTGDVECLPDEVAATAPSMYKIDGAVCGDVYRFSKSFLKKLAERIDNSNLAKVEIEIGLPWWSLKQELVEVLGELAG